MTQAKPRRFIIPQLWKVRLGHDALWRMHGVALYWSLHTFRYSCAGPQGLLSTASQPPSTMAAADSYKPSPHIKFYGRPMSTASVSEAVLNELGIEGERIVMTFDEAGTRGEAYKRDVNPNGTVPAIEHDGTVVWEASAITMYLGEVLGVERGLWPPLGPERGDAMKWTCWASVLALAGARAALQMTCTRACMVTCTGTAACATTFAACNIWK